MFLTSAKKPLSNLVLLLAAVAVTMPAAAATKEAASKQAAKSAELVAPTGGALTVSDKELNTFVFSAPISRIFFPAGSPVVGEPIYLAGGTQVMLQFAKGADETVQMIAELADGGVHTLRVQPRPVQGITHNVGGARPRKVSTAKASAQSATPASDSRAEDISLLKRIVTGDIPDTFTSIDLPKPTRFDKFTVIPMAGWTDGASRKAFVFSLVANPGQTAVVAPPQFYRAGITAVMLDGDVVDGVNSPMLYVLEEARDE